MFRHDCAPASLCCSARGITSRCFRERSNTFLLLVPISFKLELVERMHTMLLVSSAAARCWDFRGGFPVTVFFWSSEPWSGIHYCTDSWINSVCDLVHKVREYSSWSCFPWLFVAFCHILIRMHSSTDFEVCWCASPWLPEVSDFDLNSFFTVSCFDETDIHQFGPWSICKYYCNLQYSLFTNEPDVTSTGAARLATGFAKLWLTIFHFGAVLLPAMLRGSWCCVEGQKCCRRNAFVSCLENLLSRDRASFW